MFKFRLICRHIMSKDPEGNPGEIPVKTAITMATAGKSQGKPVTAIQITGSFICKDTGNTYFSVLLTL